ncbi:MAG: Gfo/Idh/MocA family oxidoreductase [Verrucomicrobiota bacterium]
MPITRRRFLASTALAVPFILPSGLRAQGPSKRLAHAAIGINGQADSDIRALMESGRMDVLAIADVDKRNHAAAKERFPNATIYQDWRELFEKEAGRIDSVNITVPDHMHGVIAMTALNLKKHVYCQKPLTHTVGEARALQIAAKKAGVVTQMGNQIHSSSEYRTAAKLVQDGAIGKVREIHCWASARFPQEVRPGGSDPVPEGLNWDQWLGVAPARPYKDSIYHPFNWRGWQDFGGGAIGDFGCHIMDTPFKAVGLTAPISVQCVGAEEEWLKSPGRFQDSWPSWEAFRYEFPGTPLTAGPTMPLYWSDGGHPPGGEALEVFKDGQIPPNGALFIGTEGSLLIVHYGGRPRLFPIEKDKAFRKNPPVPGNPQEHYTSFVTACLGEGKTTDHFDYAVPLAEATLLGTIAVRQPDKKLLWDAASLSFKDNAAATALVQPKIRDGWKVAGL